MRYLLIVLWLLFCAMTSAMAQVSIGIGLPNVSIGINLPLFPELVRVPGYPVYYAPQLNSNYFFYDGMYWVYQDDNWYASSWYNGPWGFVAPEYVPLFVLRIPIRYYRAPPAYFRDWRSDAPPRWGDHWGNEWQQQRSGWDRWNRNAAPAPAPLPVYQRQYSGNRYPRAEQQVEIHNQKYRYQPRDAVVRQRAQEQMGQPAPNAVQRRPAAGPATQLPRPEPVQRGREEVQRPFPMQAMPQPRSPAVQEQRQAPHPGAAQDTRPMPAPNQGNMSRGKDTQQEPTRGQGQERDRDREKSDERGPDRNR